MWQHQHMCAAHTVGRMSITRGNGAWLHSEHTERTLENRESSAPKRMLLECLAHLRIDRTQWNVTSVERGAVLVCLLLVWMCSCRRGLAVRCCWLSLAHCCRRALAFALGWCHVALLNAAVPPLDRSSECKWPAVHYNGCRSALGECCCWCIGLGTVCRLLSHIQRWKNCYYGSEQTVICYSQSWILCSFYVAIVAICSSGLKNLLSSYQCIRLVYNNWVHQTNAFII